MKMLTPAVAQGQIVERSYGWHDGTLYRRTEDRSDRSVTWARARWDEEAAEVEEHTGLNSDPEDQITEWVPCASPIEGV